MRPTTFLLIIIILLATACQAKEQQPEPADQDPAPAIGDSSDPEESETPVSLHASWPENLPFPDGSIIRASVADYDDAGDLQGISVVASSIVDFEPVIEHYVNLPDWNMIDPQVLYDQEFDLNGKESLVGDNDGWSVMLLVDIAEPLIYDEMGITPGETVLIATYYKPAPEELYPEAFR